MFLCNYFDSVGFEVLTLMVMKSFIFWNITAWKSKKSADVSEEHVTSVFRIEE
jgi:hypothetical protein